MFSDHNVSERQKVESKIATTGKLLDFGTVERQKSVNNNNLYVYVFHHSNSMDMRGNINYFGGEWTKSTLNMTKDLIVKCFRRAAQF